MRKENCTKGPVVSRSRSFEVRGSLAYRLDAPGFDAFMRACPRKEGGSLDEIQANSELAAEAFNVLHETGSTPRELEMALADLVATSGEVEGMMDGDKDKQEAWAEELSRLYIALDAAKAVLTKYQPKNPA